MKNVEKVRNGGGDRGVKEKLQKKITLKNPRLKKGRGWDKKEEKNYVCSIERKHGIKKQEKRKTKKEGQGKADKNKI